MQASQLPYNFYFFPIFSDFALYFLSVLGSFFRCQLYEHETITYLNCNIVDEYFHTKMMKSIMRLKESYPETEMYKTKLVKKCNNKITFDTNFFLWQLFFSNQFWS